ncbi:hypothetical protein ACQKOM_08405 [Peribacillus frigoritolerans]|uniref:hypothetical protein n=1 Tax=Peribacillus frigoritolerans TaxID=450367 RepID=UPI003D00A82C
MIGMGVRDSCGKSSPGETPQAQGAEEAPGPPAESECLEFSKKLWTSFNTKLIGAGVREPCGGKRAQEYKDCPIFQSC